MAQLTTDKITEIYCIADDFCKGFSKEIKNTKFIPITVNTTGIAHLPCATPKSLLS